MTGILNIATSALNAFQRAISVTGNNLANQATPGYSRQSANFSANMSQSIFGISIGSGVSIKGISRYNDDFANQQVRSSFSFLSQNDTFYQQSLQIEKMLSQEGTNLSAPLQKFFASLSQLNSAPDDMSKRNVMFNESQRLIEQFNSMQRRLDMNQQNTYTQISQSVTEVNRITANIAQLNSAILLNPEAGELLDSRDELLLQLSQYMDISINKEPNGTVDVSMSEGQSLVLGGVSNTLSLGTGNNFGTGTSIFLNSGISAVDISSKFTSGKLGALRDYEDNVLGHSSQLLGQMAIGLAQRFNAQHQLGVDMNGNLGKPYFTDYNSAQLQLNRAGSSSSNTGTAILSVAISDINQTQLSDYEMMVTDVSAKELRFTRKSDGQIMTLNWTDTPPAPPAGQVTLDGMTITIDDVSHLADKDTFTISPTRGAANDFALNIEDPRQIAFASAVRTTAPLTNTGSGSIKMGSVFNTNSVFKDFQIQFTSSTQYTIFNATDNVTTGPFTFTPNQENVINIPDNLNPSYSITLSGLPQTGDIFNANFNANGTGDNANGLLLAGLQNVKMFSGGNEGLSDRYSGLLSQLGSRTNQAKLNAEASQILFNQSVDRRDSISRVDPDEEGINLVRFENAYRACGQLVAVTNQLMDALFASLR